MARKHQIGERLEPLSLLHLYTPAGADVSLQEIYLRGRAAQLGNTFGMEVRTEDAIRNICQVLIGEGLDLNTYSDIELDIIKENLTRGGQPCSDDVILYHALLQRTGGDNKWTMRRHTGECCIEPYLPIILEANNMRMSSEIVLKGECLDAKEFYHGQELSKFFPYPFGWREVSVLDFINGCLPSSRVSPLQGFGSQAVVPIISLREENLTWREHPGEVDEDDEDIFLNKEGAPFLRTVGDVRVLYEGRPEPTEPMSLLEFATEFRMLKPSRDLAAYEKALGEIDPVTKIGPESDAMIAGTVDIPLPQSIMLKNGKIMVRRSKGAGVVPRLINSGAVNKYTNTLLFSPWRELETIRVRQEELETEAQKKTRLDVFPKSMFPVCGDYPPEDEQN